MKKFLALAAAIIFLAAGCGADKGITPEEFMRRYNDNLDALDMGKRFYDSLKIHGFKVDDEGKIFFTGINPELSPPYGAISAILDSNSKKIREMYVIVDISRPLPELRMTGEDKFIFFAPIILHSLDSDQKFSIDHSAELLKFLQDLTPDREGDVRKKSFNGNFYTFYLKDNKAILEIEVK